MINSEPGELSDFEDEKYSEDIKKEEFELKNYSCSKCCETFTNLLNLARHFNKNHERVNNQYLCPICPNKVKTVVEFKTKFIKSITYMYVYFQHWEDLGALPFFKKW